MKKAEADQIFTEELYRLPEKVLVILPAPWEALTSDQVLLLSKILGSVKLNLDGVQVLHHTEIELSSLIVNNPSYILSFGTRLIPECKPFSYEIVDDMTIIQSEALEFLDDSKKKSLWLALKQAFSL